MNPRLMRPLARLQSPPPPPPCEHEASLLLHFDGNLTDSSANGLTVTAVGGAATSTTQSKLGGASLYVDGDEFVTVDGSNGEFEFGTDDFTIEFWMKAGGSGGESTLVTTAYPADQQGVWVGIGNSGSLYWLAGNGSWLFVEETSSPSVQDQLWHHVAYVRNGGSLRLFLDGQQVATQNIGLSYSLTNTNDLLNIGGRTGQFFNGYIDDLRIVKGLAVYDCAFTPPTAPLSACVTPVPVSRPASLLLHFDGNLTDSSANGLALTAYNGAAVSTTQSKWGGSSLFLDGDSYLAGAGGESVCDFNGGAGTVEAWVYLTAHVPSGQYGGIVGPTSLLTQSGLSVGFGAGGVQAATYIDAGAGSGGTLNLNQWHHVAYVIESDGVTLNYYLDGVLSGTHSLTGASDQLGVIVGNPLPASLTSFTGYIDDLRVIKGLAVYKGTFTPPTAPLPAIATPQPVNASLCLNFDGSFADEGVNAVTVTAVGGAAISTSVKKFGGGSGYFDGDGDYLSATTGAVPPMRESDFTIEAWVRPTAETNYDLAMIFDNRSGAGTSGVALWQGADGLWVAYGSANGNALQPVAASTTPVALNAWTHIAAVRSGNSIFLYVNGVQDGVADASGCDFTGDSLYIGTAADSPGFTRNFAGYIDGLRITKAALYCDEFAPPTAPPTPTAVPPCCGTSAPPPPACDPYGTFISGGCEGCDFGTYYADGNCGQYFDAWSPGGCC
jgi:hypothetical protein